MQQPAHPQDGGQQQQRQSQAHHQARQVASPDIGPARQRGRHQQFVGAPGEIPRHAISRDKRQKERQNHQNGWQGTKQSSRAGSGNEAIERYAAPADTHARTNLVWRVQGPRHEKQETEEAESLKPEETGGSEATQLPGYHASQWMRALDSLGLLTSAGQCSDIHTILLLCIRVFSAECGCTSPLTSHPPKRFANFKDGGAGGACRRGGTAARWKAPPGRCSPAARAAQARAGEIGDWKWCGWSEGRASS